MFDLISIVIHVLVYASLVGIKNDAHNSLSSTFSRRFYNHRLVDPIFAVDESQFSLKPTPVFIDIATIDTVCDANNGKVPFHLQACLSGEVHVAAVSNGTFVFPSCPTRDIVQPILDVTSENAMKEGSSALPSERPILIQGQAFGPVDFTSFMANASQFTVDAPIHTAPKAIDYVKRKRSSYPVSTLDMVITLYSICHVQPPFVVAEVLAEGPTPVHRQTGFHQTAIKIIIVMLFSLVAILHDDLLRCIAMQTEEVIVSLRPIRLTFDVDIHDASQICGSLIQQDDLLQSSSLGFENVTAAQIVSNVADPSLIALPPSPQLSPVEVALPSTLPVPFVIADPIEELSALDDVPKLIAGSVIAAIVAEESASQVVTTLKNVATPQVVLKVLGISVYGTIFEVDLHDGLNGFFTPAASIVSLSDDAASSVSSPQQSNNSLPADECESPSSNESTLLDITLPTIKVTDASTIALPLSPPLFPVDVAQPFILPAPLVIVDHIEHIEQLSTSDDLAQPIISTSATEEPVSEAAIIPEDVAATQAVLNVEDPYTIQLPLSPLLSPTGIASTFTLPAPPIVVNPIQQLPTMDDVVEPSTGTVAFEEPVLEATIIPEDVVATQAVPEVEDTPTIAIPLPPSLSPTDVVLSSILLVPVVVDDDAIEPLSTLDNVAQFSTSPAVTEELILEVMIIPEDVIDLPAAPEVEDPSTVALPLSPPLSPTDVAPSSILPALSIMADPIEQLPTFENDVQSGTSTTAAEELLVQAAITSQDVAETQVASNVEDPYSIELSLSPPPSPTGIALPVPLIIADPMDYPPAPAVAVVEELPLQVATASEAIALVVSKVIAVPIYGNVLDVDLYQNQTGLFTPAASTISLLDDAAPSVSSPQQCNNPLPGGVCRLPSSPIGSTLLDITLPETNVAEPSTIVPPPSPPLSLIDVALPSMPSVPPSIDHLSASDDISSPSSGPSAFPAEQSTNATASTSGGPTRSHARGSFKPKLGSGSMGLLKRTLNGTLSHNRKIDNATPSVAPSAPTPPLNDFPIRGTIPRVVAPRQRALPRPPRPHPLFTALSGIRDQAEQDAKRQGKGKSPAA